MNYYEDRGSRMSPSNKKETVIWINDGKANKEVKLSDLMNYVGWKIGFDTLLGLSETIVQENFHHQV